MRIYDISNPELSIIAEIWDLCDADINKFPLADAIRKVNAGYETLVGIILGADGNWEFDDTNFTDLPRGVATLVDGQEAYSFSSVYLNIRMIEVLNKQSPATFIKLKPIEETDLGDQGPEQYFGLETDGSPKKGTPQYYSKEGDTIRLYPAPDTDDVTLVGGLRITFQRTIDLFTTADTTQEPSIPSPYHILLAYYGAISYCMKHKQDRVAWLEKKWDEGKAEMMKFYARREKDVRPVMKPKRIRFI